MGKTYAIADTHGRYDLVVEAFRLITEHVDASGEKSRIIVLGDFVDRGPESEAIIRFLMRFQKNVGDRLIVLQGNHEAMMLECLENPSILRWWIGNGGGEALRSYGYSRGDKMLPLKIPADHLDWLAALPITYEDEHRIYVHAGVPFDQPVAEAKRDTMQWMLYAGAEHYDDATILPDEGHVSGKHIVHGHQQSASHPLLKPHRTNLDSFAWKTGRLAIGVFDDAVPSGPVETLWATGEPM